MESSPKLKPQGTTNSSQETLSKATHYSPLTEIVKPKGKTTLSFLTKKLQPKWNKEVNFEANKIKIRKEIDQESLLNLWKDFTAVLATKRHTIPDKFQFIELSNGFSDESMRYFCLMLSKNFVDLKKLVLVLKGSSKGMEMLGFSISRSLTNLKHLSLRFNQTTQLNESLLRTLITQITTHLVHLQHFEFACFVSPLSDAGVEVFARKLCRNLVKLKELILCFDYSTALSSKCVSTVGTEIANNLPDLEYLKLRFASCPDIGSQAGIDIGNKIPTTLINLTHLLLEFTNCKFWADNSLQIIAREINQNLVSLKQLKLDFNSCSSISEEDLINLGHEMSQSKINSLRSLTLIFFQCRGTTDGGLEGLSAGINEKWKDMTYLQMIFYLTGQIGDRGLEALIPPICKHWQNLEELNLSFSANKDISDQGLQIVGMHVGTYLTKLQKLKLNFAACHQVADAGVENFVIPLYKNLKNIKELALPLNECFNLTDKALQVISQIPQNMQSLSSLDLAFTSEEITNHGLERIVDEIIEYLPELQKLSLDFPFCSKLEDGTDERLRQRLSFIPDLYVRQIYE